jgi:UDP-N-acetyl-D-galactosamine dehydrogenase
LKSEAFEGTDIQFTSDIEVLRKASFHVVAVPTPIDKNNLPDLTPLKRASETVGKVLRRVIMLSMNQQCTRATEEDCIPILKDCQTLSLIPISKLAILPKGLIRAMLFIRLQML